MEIEFRTKKLKKLCESSREATEKYGDQNAKKLIQRIKEIEANESVAMLMIIPQARCHKLKGDKKELFSVDLRHPLRLLFKSFGKIEDYIEKGNIRFEKITKITIWSVEDTHE